MEAGTGGAGHTTGRRREEGANGRRDTETRGIRNWEDTEGEGTRKEWHAEVPGTRKGVADGGAGHTVQAGPRRGRAHRRGWQTEAQDTQDRQGNGGRAHRRGKVYEGAWHTEEGGQWCRTPLSATRVRATWRNARRLRSL